MQVVAAPHVEFDGYRFYITTGKAKLCVVVAPDGRRLRGHSFPMAFQRVFDRQPNKEELARWHNISS